MDRRRTIPDVQLKPFGTDRTLVTAHRWQYPWIRAGATFEWVTPRVVLDASGYQMNPWNPTYDVSPDGERFLMVRQVADPNVGLVLVLNWFHERVDALNP